MFEKLSDLHMAVTVQLVRRSNLFDDTFYLAAYPDVAEAKVDPLEHYCIVGWREGRRPGPGFDVQHFASTWLGRRIGQINPLVAWMLLGRWMGATALPRDVAKFLASSPPPEPKAFVLIVHEATRTGAPVFALRFARWLRARKGIQPLICLLEGGAMLPEFFREFDCVPLYALPRPLWGEALSKRVAPSATCYVNSLASLAPLSALTGLPRRLIVHCHEGPASAVLFAEAMQQVAGLQPRVISVSQMTVPLLERHLGATPRVIAPAIDVAAGRAAATVRAKAGAQTDSRPLVVGCGTRSRRKGADIFCQVVAAVLASPGPPLRFGWLGRPMDVDMAEELARLGIPDKVRLEPERSDPLAYLAGASALLLASREDPFPLVALEAASCGVPVFCFDNLSEGVGAWISRGAGRMVPAFDIAAMAAALRESVFNKSLMSAYTEAARRTAESFDIEVIGPQIMEVVGYEGQSQGSALV